jgi:lipoprotein-releasing system ATP-binding protein
MSEPQPPTVALHGVRKVYGTTVETLALDGIDLTLQAGEFAALIGPSGSGKSTLLNVIGLLESPSAGRVLIQGKDTAHLDDRELTALRGRSIGFVFQFHHLLPELTAAENVAMPAAAAEGRLTQASLARAEALLTRVGLAHKVHVRANALSGGQQQRVAVARALMMRPALVLADEPTGNLDTKASDEVFALLREVNAETGTAFLIVTHDPRIAARCDRIIEIVDGRIAHDSDNLNHGAS